MRSRSRILGKPCRAVTCALAAALLWNGSAAADDYPSKPIRMIVGYAPGGGVDFTARVIAPHLGAALGTTLTVENRAGAGGTIGSEFVARAAPNGYTLVFAPASAMTTAPQAMPKAPYDVLGDFEAVNLVGTSPLILAMRPDLGVRNIKGLIEQSQHRKVTIASGGVGGLAHMVVESLNLATHGNVTHVPYKGGGPALADTVAGHIDGMVADFPPLLPMFRDHRLVAVAVTSAQRSELLPDVPAMSEDIPGFVATSWYGIFAPAKTPRAVIDKINAALRTVLARDDVKSQLKIAAVTPAMLPSADAFRKFVAEEYARWGRLIKQTGIHATPN